MAEFTIPEFITVHLGSPSSNAQNITVPFADYIKKYSEKIITLASENNNTCNKN